MPFGAITQLATEGIIRGSYCRTLCQDSFQGDGAGQTKSCIGLTWKSSRRAVPFLQTCHLWVSRGHGS